MPMNLNIKIILDFIKIPRFCRQSPERRQSWNLFASPSFVLVSISVVRPTIDPNNQIDGLPTAEAEMRNNANANINVRRTSSTRGGAGLPTARGSGGGAVRTTPTTYTFSLQPAAYACTCSCSALSPPSTATALGCCGSHQ